MYRTEYFILGQEVHDQCNNSVKQKHIRKVVEQDASVVFVIHDSFYVIVHSSEVQSTHSQVDKIPEANIP